MLDAVNEKTEVWTTRQTARRLRDERSQVAKGADQETRREDMAVVGYVHALLFPPINQPAWARWLVPRGRARVLGC
jgi:hypothetical protein